MVFTNIICLSQFHLDTVGNYIQFRQEKGADVFAEINLGDISCDYVNVKAKGKLGSFSIRYQHTTSSSNKVRITEFDHQSIVFVVNGKKISITQSPKAHNSNQLHFCSLDTDTTINRWNISFVHQQKEVVVGGGMQFSNVIRNQHKTVHLTEENGIGRGSGNLNKWTRLAGVNGKEYSTYCPKSIFKGTDVAFEVVGHHYNEIEITKSAVNVCIFTSEAILTLSNISQEISVENGQKTNSEDGILTLPQWAQGTIIGLQGGSQSVLQKLDFVVSYGAHIDAVWIQDWVGKQATKYGSRLQWKWQLDVTTYPQFEKFKAHLADRQIKLLGYINPFFAEEGEYTKEGLQKGYFVQNELGETERFNFGGMHGYMLDIFNPAAFSWMKNIIKTNLINNGFDGWMADFAEWYPLKKGKGFVHSAELHNRYAVMWAKLNREVITESGKELIFFNRSGGFEIERYSNMMWLGDQLTDYSENDGLPSVFKAYMSSAVSELPFVHSDVGGYTSLDKKLIKKVVRDEYLLQDWMLLEAFTPVFRTHEGLLPDKNAQVYSNEGIAKIFARFTKIHSALQPYFNEIGPAEEAIKPAFLEPALLGDFAFKVGEDIIIAYKPHFTMLKSIQWQLVTFEGQLSDVILPNQKVVVLVKKGSEVEKLIKNITK